MGTASGPAQRPRGDRRELQDNSITPRLPRAGGAQAVSMVPEEDSIVLAKILILKINVLDQKIRGPFGGPLS
jgi:hypothetical protein